MEFGGLFQLRIADNDQWSSLRVRSEGSDPQRPVVVLQLW
jgi:hypothetical protein